MPHTCGPTLSNWRPGMIVRWKGEDWVIRKINYSSLGHVYSLNLDSVGKPLTTTCVSPREVTRVLRVLP
jgi:hypothetical protein